MTSRSDVLRTVLVVVGLAGCGLPRPADPPPFDCANIDRADERFPDRCGEDTGVVDEDAAADEDTGAGEDAGVDAP